MKSAKLQLGEDSLQNKAYDYAVFLLGIRLRTEGELREKLKSKKYNAEAIDSVISQLKGNHYIDDERFAEVFLDNLKKYKSWGYYGIKKKFIEKKLPASIIGQVLSKGLNEEEEMEMARRFMKKQVVSSKYQAEASKTLDHPFRYDRDSGAKARLAQKLRAKGFRSGVIAKITFDS